MINSLVIDVDDLSYCQLELGRNIKNPSYELEEELEKTLKFLDEKNIKANFFIPGHFYKRSKKLVEKINNNKHFICSHGLKHDLLHSKTKEQMIYDLKTSKYDLEDIISKEVNIYKAPVWSIKKNINQCFDAIFEAGYEYDHSLIPKNFLKFGKNNYEMFKLENGLKIIPPTGINIFNKNIMFAGGFYTAYVGNNFLINYYKKLNSKNIPFNFYFHPYEIFTSQKNRKLIKYNNLFVSLYGIYFGRIFNKLNLICNTFNFDSLIRVYDARKQ